MLKEKDNWMLTVGIQELNKVAFVPFGDPAWKCYNTVMYNDVETLMHIAYEAGFKDGRKGKLRK